jgi:hypothetical protein
MPYNGKYWILIYFYVCLFKIYQLPKFNKLTHLLFFQGDSGGPLQVMNKHGRYEIIGEYSVHSNVSVELDIEQIFKMYLSRSEQISAARQAYLRPVQ